MTELTPDQIFSDYKSGQFDKTTTIDYLRSIIENSNEEIARLEALKYLAEVRKSDDKIFKILENFLISDSNEQIRSKCADLIIRNFLSLGEETIKFAIKNEKSMKCLLTILNSLEELNNAKSILLIKQMENYLGAKYKKIFNLEMREAMGFKLLELFFQEDLRSSKFNHHSGESPLMYLIKGKHVVELEFFDVRLTALDILKLFPKLEKLELFLVDIKNVFGLKPLSDLRVLRIGGKEIESIKNLDFLKNLREIMIYNTSIRCLDDIETLTTLEIIDLSSNKLTQIPNLKRLKKLKKLDLRGNLISGFNGLRIPENVYELYLNGNPITEINGLENLTKLHKLELKDIQGAKLKIRNSHGTPKEKILTKRMIKELQFLDTSKTSYIEYFNQLISKN